MAHLRIYLLITIALLHSMGSRADNKATMKQVMDNTVNMERTKIGHLDSQSIYLIITEKICSKCFETLCENLAVSPFKHHKVKIIAVVENDLLKMLNKSTQYTQLVSCADEILYHFTDAGLMEVYNMPSPQLIIPDGQEFTYLNYKESLEFADKLRGSN